MKLTKDEAAILYQALYESKYEFHHQVYQSEKIGTSCMSAFQDLEKRLSEFSEDKRRTGRTSQNSFTDILKRFILKYKTSLQ